MSRRLRTLALQVSFVLACAAVGFVVRSALTPEHPGPLFQSTTEASPPGAFALATVESREVPAGSALIAKVKRRSIVIYRHPGGRRVGRVRQRVFNKQRIPLTFLVSSHRKGWARVHLPTRPNLALAWVRRKDVDFSTTPWRIVVSQKKHRVTLLHADSVALQAKVAVGRSVSPTPLGRYYITDLIKPPNPKGFYGTYSIGLSAHSKVLTNFEGGDGQIGLHGTNQPAAIGTDVSHGCIRVTNEIVSKLARTVPLGTPVDIRA